MSDLSWLNPTPHAIAVYASRPLSPGATQHSLPSGRYSLLGPDLHRLDRTSLRLAHSLDHLVARLPTSSWQPKSNKWQAITIYAYDTLLFYQTQLNDAARHISNDIYIF